MRNSFLSSDTINRIENKLDEQKNKPGLYVVATPIGNILDITFRALSILKKSKYIFAEDTRNSQKLLNFFGIKSKLIACHEHNEIDESVTSLIKNDEIYSLISDAGTPAISDPGYRIVKWCVENEVDVIPVPGPSSLVAGLSVSGIATDKFIFFGFISTKKKSRIEFFNSVKNQKATMIFFETARRLKESLSDMLQVFGDRYCCICREMTKVFEEFFRAQISEAIKYFSENKLQGEFVIIVSGNVTNTEIDNEIISIALHELLQKFSLKEAVQFISNQYGISKHFVYKKALEIKEK